MHKPEQDRLRNYLDSVGPGSYDPSFDNKVKKGTTSSIPFKS